jgi:integrase
MALGHTVYIRHLKNPKNGVYPWKATWSPGDGERPRESYFLKEKEARAFKRQKEKELRNHGYSDEFSSPERSAVNEYRDLLSEYGLSIRDGLRLGLEVATKRSRSSSVEDLFLRFMGEAERSGSRDRTLKDLRSRVGRFAGDFGGTLICDIEPIQISDWLSELNLSPASVRNYRRVLITFFNFAVRQGFTEKNPAQQTTRPKVAVEEPHVVTPQEAARMLESAHESIVPALAISLFAGLRPDSEIGALDWSDIDLIHGEIRVRRGAGKTGMKRIVTIQPNLREWLMPFAKCEGRVRPGSFDRRIREARRCAGYGPTEPHFTDKHRKQGLKPWQVDATRHSFGSYFLESTEDVARTAHQMGNSPAIVEKHYRKVVSKREAERYWNILPEQDISKVVALGH